MTLFQIGTAVTWGSPSLHLVTPVLQTGVVISLSLVQALLGLLSVLLVAFLGSYFGMVGGMIRREEEIKRLREFNDRLWAAMEKEEADRKTAIASVHETIDTEMQRLERQVNTVNNRVDRILTRHSGNES